MKAGHCRAIGCRAAILPTELFCERCAALLHSDVARILARQYRPGKPHQSQVFNMTLARAVDEVLYAKTIGHRVPRAQEFEF